MRGAWIVVVATLAGCDVVYGLSGRADAAVDAAPPIDAVVPEQCSFGSPTQVVFASNVEPLHDFADDGAGHGFVSAFVTESSITTSRTTAILPEKSTWIHDLTVRDGVGGFTGVRPDPDPSQIYGLVNITTTNFLARFQLDTSGWSMMDMNPIDQRERVGNYRVLDGKRVYVTTQRPVIGDPSTRLILRVRDGASWNEEDKMAAINVAQIPDLGVITRDGLTLIYSARKRTELQFDLYISVRATLDDQFPVGTIIDQLSTDASEVEPWMSGGCDRLYFRRGRTFFDEVGERSSIFVATAPSTVGP